MVTETKEGKRETKEGKRKHALRGGLLKKQRAVVITTVKYHSEIPPGNHRKDRNKMKAYTAATAATAADWKENEQKDFEAWALKQGVDVK